MSLLETYEAMQKEAQVEQEKQERVEMLVKYASAAEELLEKEYGTDYQAEDVEKLAENLIALDMQTQEEQEKVAEYTEAGRIIARAYIEELKNATK